jgi:hypothetical protein
LMRPNGLKGPMRMPAMRNQRIIGCLRTYASAPTAEQTKKGMLGYLKAQFQQSINSERLRALYSGKSRLLYFSISFSYIRIMH